MLEELTIQTASSSSLLLFSVSAHPYHPETCLIFHHLKGFLEFFDLIQIYQNISG